MMKTNTNEIYMQKQDNILLTCSHHLITLHNFDRDKSQTASQRTKLDAWGLNVVLYERGELDGKEL